MGTRNLTVVVLNGEYKIAQYGQWDGYPTGQGITICKFLQTADLDKFKSNLNKCRFLDSEGKDKEFIESYQRNAPEWSNDPDNRTPEQRHWWSTYISRDLGGEILNRVLHSEDAEILLRDYLNFAADSLSCEWAYVVDLDNNKLEIFQGFNKTPLAETERFYFLEEKSDEGYHPVRKVAEYPFSEATPEAMKALEASFSEEEAAAA